ncbi:uncharacterized protein NPIL_440891 [Nephila pilipes]|uniref:Uncharacterized protein n=1 Tax=Nephila pilipes TaxID=299642 RepID=A0A8X6P5I6_NEPPI|nr:uncharacterized protein NPIL_440891 [Nephila pilipes]
MQPVKTFPLSNVRGVGKYTLYNPPTLENMVLLELSIVLCYKRKMKHLLFHYLRDCRSKGCKAEPEWSLIQETALQEVQFFPLSSELQLKIVSLGLRLLKNIFEWIDFHCVNPYLQIGIPRFFCWTQFGAINKRLIATKIVSCQWMNSVIKFKIACIYCLFDQIFHQWRNIPDAEKEQFLNKDDSSAVKQHGLVIYWTEIVTRYGNYTEDRLSELKIFHEAFVYAAVTANLAAIQYFTLFLKEEHITLLTYSVQSISWKRKWASNMYSDEYEGFVTFPVDDLFDCFYFIISLMCLSDQNSIICARPLEFLRSFLVSPRQKFFIKMMKRVWHLIPKNTFTILIRDLFLKDLETIMPYEHSMLFYTFSNYTEHYLKVHVSSFNYNYRRLFVAVWERMPFMYKEKISMHSDCGSGFLYHLLFRFDPRIDMMEDFIQRREKIIELLLKSRTTKARVADDSGRVGLFKFLIQEDVATAKSMDFFQNAFVTLEEYKANKIAFDQKFKLISLILDDYSKRKLAGLPVIDETRYIPYLDDIDLTDDTEEEKEEPAEEEEPEKETKRKPKETKPKSKARKKNSWSVSRRRRKK